MKYLSGMINEHITKWITDKKIPGAVLVILKDNNIIFEKAYGQYFNGKGHVPMTKTTIFDVASLTKVMVTLPSILYLISQQKISFNQSVSKYIPSFKYSKVTIKHLLLHTSGLPADLPYVERNASRNVIIEILNADLKYTPGKRTLYSDLGMILLGMVIEVVSGNTLDKFISKHIFNKINMDETVFLPDKKLHHRIAATEQIKGEYIHGEVHDEKAYHMGGVSGSAGLFSTARDIGKYASWWMNPDDQSLLPPQLMKEAVSHYKNNRGLGFEVWSGSGLPLSCGSNWPIGSFGHTGFTGTSLWFEPNNKVGVILLTNALQYGRNGYIREIRSALHDNIYSSIIEG